MSHEQDDIVISGVGGFFPRAINLDQFKDLLFTNEELLDSRWKEGELGVSNKLGVCPNIQYFDNSVFGIHRQQTTFMDPMQRLMLERTFEALTDAGVNIQDVRGKRIGVFMGSSVGENDNLFYESVASGFGVTGHSRAMLANRISYWLNIKGPSCAYDTNWTNGLQVIQLAWDAISMGHCEAAIVGTTNLALNSEISYHYKEMGFISPEGSTKPFDNDACGYARSDGIVALYMQRAKDAKRVYASVVKASVKFDGCRDGPFLDCDTANMCKFIGEFYEDCPVQPEELDYMECYGCGVKDYDEAELNAIDEAVCKKRNRPLLIGSVKANTGHSEATASLFDVAKVLIAMETGKIPATINHKTPNSAIGGLVDGRLKVVTDNKEFQIKYAAINNIGISSSYGHCVLKAHHKKKVASGDEVLPRLVVLSTRNEEGIDGIFNTLKAATYDPEYYCLIQDVFSKTINGHIRRGYMVLDKNGEISKENGPFEGIKRPVWFVFSGMGSQWTGMGKGLLKIPMFAETIQKCHNCLTPYGIDLLDIITTDDAKIFDNILHSFVGIAAIQIALTDILKAMGVVPNGIIGHSVGELGCAYADDCLTAEQMMLCAYSRGKASLDAELIEGMMAAIGLGYDQIKSELPDAIEVACHNSASSCTISGPTADMEVYVKSLQDKGIFARLVNVSNIAYHSRYIKPAAPLLLDSLKAVIPVPVKRSPKWVSTSITENKWDSPLAKTSSAEYHTNNLLSSVLFEEGSKHIPKDAVVIEIAPHGLLQAILKKSMKSGCINIPLTHRTSEDPVNFLLAAIGKIHLAGVDVKVQNIYPKIEYPVSRGTTCLAPLVRWEHSESWRTGTEEKIHNLSTVKDISITLSDEKFKYLFDHQLDGRIVYNLASYLNAVINILTVSRSIEITHVAFENIRFREILEIPRIGDVPFFGSVQRGNGDFEIISAGKVLITGRILVEQPKGEFQQVPRSVEEEEPLVELSSKDLYTEFAHRGYDYKGTFTKIEQMKMYKKGTRAVFAANQNWCVYLECLLQQSLLRAGEKYQDLRMPTYIKRINISIPDIPKDENEEIISNYEYSTETLSIKGVQLIGVSTDSLPLRPKPISYDTLKFIPFEKYNCPSLEMMLNVCVNLAIDNFTGVTNNLVVTEVASKGGSMIEALKNVTAKYSKIQAFINTTSDPNINITIRTDAVLFIYNGEINQDLIQSILKSEAFCLVRTTKSLLTKEIETLNSFILNGIHYSLVHPASTKQAKYVEVNTNSLNAEDVFKQTRTWSKNLKNLLRKQRINEDVYLLSREAPKEGVWNFVKRLRSDPLYEKLKFIFALDKKVKTDACKLARKNSFLCVHKNGMKGCYVSVSMDFNEKQTNDHEISKFASHDYTFACFGINSDNETIGAVKTGLGNIDYAAVNGSNERVMGLAKYDKDLHNIVLDDVLQWKVPNSWSMEDACTIPHAYVIAYRILVQKGGLSRGKHVLIDSGCSAIGLAAISVALGLDCTVFTTVATDEQKSFLKTAYPQLNEKNIFRCKDAMFDLKLLSATDGNGVDVIVNCQEDSLMQASIRCLNHFGRFVQLGKLDIRKNHTIGLGIFLKNTAMTAVIPEDVFELYDDEKRQLHELIQAGLSEGRIVPLRKLVVEHQDIKRVLRQIERADFTGKAVLKVGKQLAMSRFNVDNTRKFVCDGASSYFVCGGYSKIWAYMTEWLILRGAKKILIDASDADSQPRHIKHRIELLKNHFKASVVFVAKHHKGAAELISEVYSHGPIHGVYILPGTENEELKSVAAMETTLRTIAPKALFVSFLEGFSGTCENRLDAGFPTYNIQWEDGLGIDEILYGLDDILSFRQGSVTVKNDKVDDKQTETAITIYKRLLLLLPSSPEDMIDNFNRADSEPKLVQLLTNGPANIREVPPLFIIPGLFGQSVIADFARELIYPVFCAVMPNKFVPLNEAIKIFAEKIVQVFPRGPYNIIGISTGGILATEIAKVLQEKKSKIQVTLIDGAPDSILSSLMQIGQGSTGEVNLLTSILKIYNPEMKVKLVSLPDWNSRLTEALQLQEHLSEDDKKTLHESILLLKQNTEELSKFQPSSGLLKGQVFLLRPSGSSKLNMCGLEKYFEQTPQLSVFEGDHVSVLSSKAVNKMINVKVIVV